MSEQDRKQQPRTILLVEDQAIISMAEAQKLSAFGYTVKTAVSGEKAVEAVFNGTGIDLILMDIDLGAGMDGTETARIILEKCDLPIVFLTAHSEKEMVDRVQGITRYGYIIKNSGDFVLQSSIEMAFQLFEMHKKHQNSEFLMRTLVKNIPDLVWMKDAEGVYLSCNRRFEEFYGAKEHEIVGKTDYDFVDRELADFFRAHDQIAMEAGKSVVNEEWITFKSDGSETLLETKKSPIYDTDGAIMGVLGIGRDITSHRRFEEALRETEQRYQTALDNMPNLIVILNGERQIQFVNKSVTRIFNQGSEHFIGRLDSEVWPDLYKAWDLSLSRALELGKVQTTMVVYPAKGDKLNAEMVFVPLFDSNGCVNEVMVITTESMAGHRS